MDATTNHILVPVDYSDKSVFGLQMADKFLKVHKSYIVALSKVDSIEGNEIRIGQHHIPISRNQKEEVMDKLLKNRFLKR